ncbi:hypothetical protein Terrestrivirus1_28 [Carp edema virus]|nr:hypothetical protein Terrestrivirus1_28 [Carp edema virus]
MACVRNQLINGWLVNLVLVIATTAFLVININGIEKTKVVKKGFVYEDPSISKLKAPSDLSGVQCVLTLFTFGLTILAVKYTYMTKIHFESNPFSWASCGKLWVTYSYKVFFEQFICYFGSVITLTIVNLIKVNAMVMRPYYLSRCQPTFTRNFTRGEWVKPEEYSCTKCPSGNTETDFDKCSYFKLYNSFCSGHSAAVWYFTIVFILYFRKFLVRRHYSMLQLMSSYFLIFFATYISFGRIRTNHHRLDDVIAGSAIGGLSGYLWFASVSSLFKIDDFTLRPEQNLRRSIARVNSAKTSEELRKIVVGDKIENPYVPVTVSMAMRSPTISPVQSPLRASMQSLEILDEPKKLVGKETKI